MKKLFITTCMCLLAYYSGAQNKYADSLKTELANTTEPIQRFDLLNRIFEDLLINGNANADSASSIEMLGIAQAIKQRLFTGHQL